MCLWGGGGGESRQVLGSMHLLLEFASLLFELLVGNFVLFIYFSIVMNVYIYCKPPTPPPPPTGSLSMGRGQIV